MDAVFYQAPPVQDKGELSLEESRHCARVLRKSKGDLITITDGAGAFYSARLTEVHSVSCTYHVQSKTSILRPDYSIHLAVSPTKNPDRLEWMIEKCTELGFDEFTPLLCKNTERQSISLDRLQKKCLSALKQAQRAWLPVIHPAISFHSFLQKIKPDTARYIAYVDFDNPRQLLTTAQIHKHYVLLIGPEGDFTPDELHLAEQRGFVKVALGNFRLRTETAGLAGCHILNLINQRNTSITPI
jgi:16S rRNA (uracil1498-N3)-methyltransferase